MAKEKVNNTDIKTAAGGTIASALHGVFTSETYRNKEDSRYCVRVTKVTDSTVSYENYFKATVQWAYAGSGTCDLYKFLQHFVKEDVKLPERK